LWKAGVLTLNGFYLWDSMITWAVRAHDGVQELNPVIWNLQQMNALFYVAFRAGALLMVNALLWQIYVDCPQQNRTRWLKPLLTVGLAVYAVPLVMSFLLLL
jgi:hypothetical protein